MSRFWPRIGSIFAGMALLLAGCAGQPAASSVSDTVPLQTAYGTSTEENVTSSPVSMTNGNAPDTGTTAISHGQSENTTHTNSAGTSASSVSSSTTTTTTSSNVSTEPFDPRNTFVLSTFMALDGDTNLTKNQRILCNTRDAGLNLVEVTWLSTEESILAALRAAETVPGISLLVQNARGADQKGTNLGGIGTAYMPASISAGEVNAWVKKLQGYSSLAGYYVWDEPNSQRVEDCRKLTDFYQAADPERLAFSCILPSYGEYRWPSSYPAYVDAYIQTVQPAVLSLNYYPFNFQSSIQTTSDLYRDMGYMRKKSLENKIPYWHYFQAIKDGKSLTVPQIQVQMMLALAYGVKGLSYYTSQYSITDVNGNPTANYAALKSLNTRVKNIGNFLYNKTNAALYHTGLDASANAQYFLDELSASPWLKAAPANLVIGVFTDATKVYLAVANKSHTSSVSGTLELQKNFSIAEYLPEKNITRDLSCGNTISLALGAAEIQVFVLS